LWVHLPPVFEASRISISFGKTISTTTSSFLWRIVRGPPYLNGA
jgi:hypothetical protein